MTNPASRPAEAAVSDESPWADLVESGHLQVGDTLVARRIARLCNEPPESPAALALALAVRAVREGSTALDLARAADMRPEQDDDSIDAAEISGISPPEAVGPVESPESSTDAGGRRLSDVRELLPAPDWLGAVSRSPLAAQGVLRLDFGLVYLDRYHADESLIAERLLAREAAPLTPWIASSVPITPPEPDRDDHPNPELSLNTEQHAAVTSVLSRATTVLTGGPGMGKTHTIGGVLRTVRAAAGPDVRIALAAPTGKAAARLSESLTDQGIEFVDSATTLHRLLGSKHRGSQRFRHDRHNPLPHDLVVVDEASMISLSMMARLLEALPHTTRLLLVGDPDQLASVEAGSVLRDVAEGLGTQRGVVQLVQEFRLASRRAELARAFRCGDADAVLNIVTAAAGYPGGETTEAEVRFIETDAPQVTDVPGVVAQAERLRELALSGDRAATLDALGASRLLCAHRTGPFGTRRWNRIVEQALAERWPDIAHQEMYVGRPMLVTHNDYGLGVTNGDTGIVMRNGDHLTLAFADDSPGRSDLSPWRLADVETMHAMTVHKAQGSQADHVTVIVPPVGSRLLSREMLYTAVTRARKTLTIVGTVEAVRAAVEAPAERSSGLSRRLRDDAASHGPLGARNTSET